MNGRMSSAVEGQKQGSVVLVEYQVRLKGRFGAPINGLYELRLGTAPELVAPGRGDLQVAPL